VFCSDGNSEQAQQNGLLFLRSTGSGFGGRDPKINIKEGFTWKSTKGVYQEKKIIME
jgi:hypothetical protein